MNWRNLHVRVVHKIALQYRLLWMAKRVDMNKRILYSQRRRCANIIVECLGLKGDGYYPGRVWRRKFHKEHGFWPSN